MATYRVIRKGHWVNGSMIPPGGLVEINGDLPALLADRLELVSEVVPSTDDGNKEVSKPDSKPDETKPWRTLPSSIVEQLVAAGFTSPELVNKATDDQLLGIQNIGAAKVKVIREILA